jgi:dTDP-4-dehydrorhamnose reductase
MMIRMAAAQEELRIVDDQWGSPTSTTELAEAIFQIRSKLGSESWGTYHFGGKGETTWYGFASHIVDVQARYTGRRPSMKAISTAEFPTKARRPRNSVLNSSRFAEVFGFSAEPWEHAVDRTIAKLYAGVRP